MCYPNEDRTHYVHEGEKVIVECPCNGTEMAGRRILSHWSINGVPIPQHDLPPRHTVNNSDLIIDPVKASDNGTIYQCLFVNISGTAVTLHVNVNSTGKDKNSYSSFFFFTVDCIVIITIHTHRYSNCPNQW